MLQDSDMVESVKRAMALCSVEGFSWWAFQLASEGQGDGGGRAEAGKGLAEFVGLFLLTDHNGLKQHAHNDRGYYYPQTLSNVDDITQTIG